MGLQPEHTGLQPGTQGVAAWNPRVAASSTQRCSVGAHEVAAWVRGAAASSRTGLQGAGCRASARLDEVCAALGLLVPPAFGAVRVPLDAVRDAAELSQHTRARRVLAPLREERRTGSRGGAWGGGLDAWGYTSGLGAKGCSRDA